MGHKDTAAADTLRSGARILGALPAAHNGSPSQFAAGLSVDSLRASCRQRNIKTLRCLREDTNLSCELWKQTLADATLGRMSMPVAASNVDLDDNVISPRFGVQQRKEDVSLKERPLQPSLHL